MYRLRPEQDQFMTILPSSMTLTFNLPEESFKGTSTRRGQQLCQIILKSLHICTSYDLDKSGWTHDAQRTHIHRTGVVTIMPRSPQAGSI